MTPRKPLPSRPVADPARRRPGTAFRITVLTDGLVRLEYSPDGAFEDRAIDLRAVPRPAGARTSG